MFIPDPDPDVLPIPDLGTRISYLQHHIFDPWIRNPGWIKKSRSGSGIRTRDEHPGSYFRELRKKIFGLKIPKFCYADPDPGSGIFLTLDPLAGMEKLAPLFQDKQPEPQYCFYAWTHNSEKTEFLKTSKLKARKFAAYDTEQP